MSFLTNIVAASNLNLSLFKTRFRHWWFPDSYLKFLANFLKSIVIRKKKQCYKKRGSDVYRKSNYATFYLTSPRFLYFSIVHSNNGLCIYRFISWKKLLKVVNNTPTIGLWRSLTSQNSHAFSCDYCDVFESKWIEAKWSQVWPRLIYISWHKKCNDTPIWKREPNIFKRRSRK